LGECFATTLRFDESNFANPPRQVAARQFALSRGIRIRSDRAHEGAPGKLSDSQRPDYAIGRRLKRFNVSYVSCKFFCQECVNFRIKIGGLDRRRLSLWARFV